MPVQCTLKMAKMINLVMYILPQGGKKEMKNAFCGLISRVEITEQTISDLGVPPVVSGLRIQPCHSCGEGCSCSLDYIPGWELPNAAGATRKVKTKRNKKTHKNPPNPWES